MPSRSLLSFAIAVAATLTVLPLAAEQSAPRAAVEPEAIGGATVPFARVALFYGALTGDVIRSKGVVNFKRFGTGRYCIKAEINVENVVPNVTVERLESPSGAGLLAYWRSDPQSCANNRRWIEVRTYRFAAGENPVLTNDVSFTLTVP